MTILERIDAGDADGVLDSIAGMTAAERSAAYARVTPEVERLHELVHVQGQQWAHPNGTDAQRRAAAAAVLGLATGEQMGGRRFGDAALIADAVRRCAPGWATPEGLRTCTERSTSFFPTIALLVREGLAAWPEGDAVVEHVASVGFRSRVPLVDVVRDRLAGTLDFLYRLFEVEGGQTTSLASCDKYRRDENKWSTTLLALSATGELDRDRLLTASLEALERDFAPFRAGWYKRFHDALKPTPADRAARKDHYVRLLGSAVPQTVSFAVGQVDRLARKKLVGDEALDALRPVMTAKAKATVVKAVKLAQRLARTPEETTLACELLLDALLHEEVAVQEAALDALDALLPKASEPERLRASLADSRPLLRPSLRGRLPEVEAPADEPDTVVPVRVDPLHPSRALAGMPSLAETVQLAAEGLEVPDPLVLERAWAGMVHHRVDEDTVAAVRKRARKLLDAANANDRVMRSAHARLVLVWAGETLRPWPGWMPQTPAQGFFLGYHAELAARVADDDPTPLLSTPSHQDGWLHPDVLTSRLPGRPGRHELALAAHRLPDDARAPGGPSRPSAHLVLRGPDANERGVQLPRPPPVPRPRRRGRRAHRPPRELRAVPCSGAARTRARVVPHGHPDGPTLVSRRRRGAAVRRPRQQPHGGAPLRGAATVRAGRPRAVHADRRRAGREGGLRAGIGRGRPRRHDHGRTLRRRGDGGSLGRAVPDGPHRCQARGRRAERGRLGVADARGRRPRGDDRQPPRRSRCLPR
jgi:hypothetical protein